MRINQNIAALNAYRHLSITDSRLNRSLERLSSGLRINRAADDAAGLAISEKMRAQIRGLRMALRNAQDGISLIQTAEGAINEIHSMLQRMRELAVQAANETYTSSDRVEIQKEIDQLKDEIDRISNTTEFNTRKLLDGSSSAIVSSDRLSTHVYMRDGLRYVDQFGQKFQGGGNYRIEIKAEKVGNAQVQKSNIFMIKHDVGAVQDVEINRQSGIIDLAARGLQYGNYEVVTETGAAASSSAQLTQQYLQGTAMDIFGGSGFTVTDGAENNASILFEVTGVDLGATSADGTITFSITSHQYDADGNYSSFRLSGQTVSLSTTSTINIGDITISIDDAGGIIAGDIVVGDKAVINVRGNTASADLITVNYEHYEPEIVTGTVAHKWAFNGDALNKSTSPLRFFTLDLYSGSSTFGQAFDGEIALTIDELKGANPAAEFTYASGLGKLADINTRLYDIREFWDKSGRFLLESPQTIYIVQGDGTKSFFTIDQNDTLGTLRAKINKAISEDLNQKRYLDESMEDSFVSYVTGSIKEEGTHISTEGTLVVRSVIPGRQGELNIFGHADIINALGFATIQQSSETIFNIKVTNAHDATEVIANDIQISSNLLVGIVHPYVDVEFDPLAGIGVVNGYDDKKAFATIADVNPHITYIHLKDSTMVFQIGPNPGQDVGAAIGRLDSWALGVRGISVTDRDKANKAMDALDRAMDLVSSERSKLGAMQNRLEHTVNSLGVAIENLTASESRIRDLDIAEEMVELTRNQILIQAGTAMLAQANMKPQSIMKLLG